MSNFIGNNINAIRVDYGYNQEDLAAAIGATQAAVSAWECGESTPRKSNVLKLINAIPGITFDDIMSEHNGYAAKAFKNTRSQKNWIEIPYYGSIAAGVPIEMMDIADTYLVPSNIIEEHPNSGVLKIKGNSWNKEIPNGYMVVVDFDMKRPSNDREPFAVSIDDSTATVKAIEELENGIRLLPNSYDPTIKPMTFDYGKDEGTTVSVLGKVVWVFAPFDYKF